MNGRIKADMTVRCIKLLVGRRLRFAGSPDEDGAVLLLTWSDSMPPCEIRESVVLLTIEETSMIRGASAGLALDACESQDLKRNNLAQAGGHVYH